MLWMVVGVFVVICVVGTLGMLSAKQQKAWDKSVEANWSAIIAYKPTEPLTPEQLSQLLLSGTTFVVNQDNFNQLASAKDHDELREVLEQMWGVTDAESLRDAMAGVRESCGAPDEDKVKALEGLRDGKVVDSEEYEGALSIVTLLRTPEAGFADDLRREVYQVQAWDIQRLACLARWGVALKLITPQEAWETLGFCSAEAQRYYTSWKAFSLSYLVNRGIWAGPVDDDSLDDWNRFIQAHKMMMTYEASPLKQASAWR